MSPLRRGRGSVWTSRSDDGPRKARKRAGRPVGSVAFLAARTGPGGNSIGLLSWLSCVSWSIIRSVCRYPHRLLRGLGALCGESSSGRSRGGGERGVSFSPRRGTRSGRPHPVAYEGFSSYCGITSVDLFRRNPIRVSFSGHSLGIIETVRGGFELGPGRGPRPRSAFVLLPAGKRTDPLRPGSGYVRSEEDRMTGKRDEQTECPRHDDPSRQIHHRLRSSGLTRRLLAAARGCSAWPCSPAARRGPMR